MLFCFCCCYCCLFSVTVNVVLFLLLLMLFCFCCCECCCVSVAANVVVFAVAAKVVLFLLLLMCFLLLLMCFLLPKNKIKKGSLPSRLVYVNLMWVWNVLCKSVKDLNTTGTVIIVLKCDLLRYNYRCWWWLCIFWMSAQPTPKTWYPTRSTNRMALP